MRQSQTRFLLALALLLAGFNLEAAAAPQMGSPGLDPDALQQFSRSASPDVKLRARRGSRVAGLVRAGRDRDLLPGSRATTARAKADEFLRRHGKLFGLARPDKELQVVGESSDPLGMQHVHYRQTVNGVEVFGSGLRAHFDKNLALTSVSGTVVPIEGPLATVPLVSGVDAETIATAKGLAGALSRRLVVYDTGLLRGVAGLTRLAWEIEIANTSRTTHEWVLVDALDGAVLDRISGIMEARRRTISETNLANIIWDESLGNPEPIPGGWAGGTLGQTTSWNEERAGARESYNLFGSLTNGAYLSYDGAEATMRSVNNAAGISCPNASWNGRSTNYCSGVTGDDTVAHEWTHAYTQFTHGLIYAYQSGALNESYSDIFGEMVDLLNGRGSDTPNDLRAADGSACSTFGAGTPATDASYRWLASEDSSAFFGAIRDLWRPGCYGHPDKVNSAQYRCGTSDSGGVHKNSGVPNHAFALLVDGGTFNGQTITGMGLEKAAHIYWRAATVYQISTSNFEDHADALEASCGDLIGASLYTPVTSEAATWGSLLSASITTEDCAEVSDAIAAVELRFDPATICNHPVLSPFAPPLCSDSTVIEAQDWESGPGAWTMGTRAVAQPSNFDTPDWAVVTNLPDGRAGSAAFVADADLGNCASDIEAGVLYLQSPSLVIPPGSSRLRLAFDHWLATEAEYDGGNVKMSVNGGPFELIPASSFVFNAYNGILLPAPGSDDPLAGEPAFTGADAGTGDGSWGQSQINLGSLAESGDTVQLRFEFGLDGCSGVVGWYLDDIKLYACRSLCGPAPETGCRSSGPMGASLALSDGSTGAAMWKLTRGDATTLSDFLDPRAAGTDLNICLYDSSASVQPIGTMSLASGGSCAGVDCWENLGDRSYRYQDKTGTEGDGVTLLSLQKGEQGRAKIFVKAKGAALELPALPLTPPVTAQLTIDDGQTRNCWESSFSTPLVNNAGRFRATAR